MERMAQHQHRPASVPSGTEFFLVRHELAVDKIYKAGRETMIRVPPQKIVAEGHTRFSHYETRSWINYSRARADKPAASRGRSAGRCKPRLPDAIDGDDVRMIVAGRERHAGPEARRPKRFGQQGFARCNTRRAKAGAIVPKALRPQRNHSRPPQDPRESGNSCPAHGADNSIAERTQFSPGR